MDEPRTRRSRLLQAGGALAVAAFVGLLAFGLARQAPESTIDDALARSEAPTAPGFALAILERGNQPPSTRRVVDAAVTDGRVALSELRGSPVVLNFWASWCDPCRTEAPTLERAAKTFGPRGVIFVGLNMQDVTTDARAFMRKLGVSYLNVREGGADTSRRYGATGLPETYFISARGEVVAHVIGAVDHSQLRTGIDAALAGRPVDAREGGARQEAR